MNTVKLVAIVNSFNRLPLLQKAIPSLCSALNAADAAAAVVIFDAGSTDGSLEWLSSFGASPHELTVIHPAAGEDSSFSAGVNAACEYAASRYPQCENYLFYETDNWIATAQPLRLAVKLLGEKSDLAAAGFTVSKHNGQPAGVGCPFPTVCQFLLGQQLTHWLKLDRPRLTLAGEIDGTGYYYCDVVYTSPLVVKRAAWEQSKGMDSKAFPFSDCDIDWAWRLNELGWKQAVLETTGVVHDNLEKLSSWSSQRTLLFHRSRLRLLIRHRGRWVQAIWPLLMLRHLAELAAALVLQLFGYPPEAVQKRWALLRAAAGGYNCDSV